MQHLTASLQMLLSEDRTIRDMKSYTFAVQTTRTVFIQGKSVQGSEVATLPMQERKRRCLISKS